MESLLLFLSTTDSKLLPSHECSGSYQLAHGQSINIAV